MHVKHLRDKLGAVGRRIVNVRGVGYKLVAARARPGTRRRRLDEAADLRPGLRGYVILSLLAVLIFAFYTLRLARSISFDALTRGLKRRPHGKGLRDSACSPRDGPPSWMRW